MLDPNPTNQKEFQIIRSASFLNGVFFDPSTGPITASRPAAVLNPSSIGGVREIDDSVTEDIFPENELDAHYAQLGWPSPGGLPGRPWDIMTPRAQRTRGTEIWGSRRFMVQRWAVNVSRQDLRPVDALVEAVEAALRQQTNALRIRGLREVFTTWGEMIPLNAVIGACMVATGRLSDQATLPDSSTPSRYSSEDNTRRQNLTEIVDQHLGTTSCFARRLETRVQGGSSEALLSEGYEAWLKSAIGSPASWRIIKVNHAVPITEILEDQLREKVEQLYTNSVILRSPSVGAPHSFGFDSAINGLRAIEKITLWFSSCKIRDIAVTYAGGIVAGPYSSGISNHGSQSDSFVLAPGEYITDLFVWHHTDGWISGIQFVKDTLELSPIYGIRSQDNISTHPPVLLSGNGNVLLGLSGAYTSDSLSQLQASAVWRSDIVIRRQRHTQTSYIGANAGLVFNDLQYLADPATARIAQITARNKDSVASFRVTYESVSGGALVRSETPARGSHTGPLVTMTLEDGEYITGVRGHHLNQGGLQRIQFVTNKKTHPAFGADTGTTSFSIDAPKTRDGRDMVLHYMAGKSYDWLDGVLFVWAEMPLQAIGVNQVPSEFRG